MDNRTIKLSGFAQPITRDRLQELASRIGQVEFVSVTDKVAEVRYKTADRAQAALNQLAEEMEGVKMELVKVAPSRSTLKLAFVLLVLGLLYYFVIRKFIFEHIPKDAPLTHHEPAHYPRYKLMANTLNDYVRNVKPKASRRVDRAVSKKAEKEVETGEEVDQIVKKVEKKADKGDSKKVVQKTTQKKVEKAVEKKGQKVITTEKTTQKKIVSKTPEKPVKQAKIVKVDEPTKQQSSKPTKMTAKKADNKKPQKQDKKLKIKLDKLKN